MKVLIPIDGSSFSDNAVQFFAKRHTLAEKPEIELLVVLPELPGKAARLIGKDSLGRYFEEEADKILAPARATLKAAGLSPCEAYLVGDPSECIAEESDRLNVDLIVMGSRGLTALAGLFFGSVTNGVLARTKKPILIVRGKEVRDTDSLRVGIAVDGSKFGTMAVRHALANRDMFGPKADFHLINVTGDYAGAVMPDMAGMALPALSESEVVELQKKEFSETVEPLRPLFDRAGMRPKEVCLVGNPGDEIAAYAKAEDLDLVILGSHGYGRFKSAVMGSTAMRIAAQGNVPILLVRE